MFRFIYIFFVGGILNEYIESKSYYALWYNHHCMHDHMYVLFVVVVVVAAAVAAVVVVVVLVLWKQSYNKFYFLYTDLVTDKKRLRI